MRVKKIVSAVIGIPIAVLLILFAVANREPVTLSLDPFAPDTPALAVSMPLFVLVILALMLGVIVGGVADWLRQGRYRKEARSRRAEVRRLEAERERLREGIDRGPALPAPRP